MFYEGTILGNREKRGCMLLRKREREKEREKPEGEGWVDRGIMTDNGAPLSTRDERQMH